MKANVQLTPHFNLREFLHNGSTAGLTVDIVENLRRTAQMLEKIREICGNHPISISSGFRTKAHNAAVGGAGDSLHLLGMAADFTVAGVPPSTVQKLLRNHNGGLGSYSTWTHADWGRKRRWTG